MIWLILYPHTFSQHMAKSRKFDCILIVQLSWQGRLLRVVWNPSYEMECVTLGCQLEKKLQVQFYSWYVGMITYFYGYKSNSEATNFIGDSFLTIAVWKIPQGILFSENVKPNFWTCYMSVIFSPIYFLIITF